LQRIGVLRVRSDRPYRPGRPGLASFASRWATSTDAHPGPQIGRFCPQVTADETRKAPVICPEATRSTDACNRDHLKQCRDEVRTSSGGPGCPPGAPRLEPHSRPRVCVARLKDVDGHIVPVSDLLPANIGEDGSGSPQGVKGTSVRLFPIRAFSSQGGHSVARRVFLREAAGRTLQNLPMWSGRMSYWKFGCEPTAPFTYAYMQRQASEARSISVNCGGG
jgi:hypothetical protein